MKNPACRLYLITPPDFQPGPFAHDLKAALSGGDVAAVQLRIKDASDDAVRAAARVLMPITQDAGAAFILNDRPDLAAELGADGVHVGQTDTPYAEARAILGESRIVGVTCHNSRHLAMEAAEAGADYVAFGAFYPTETKDAQISADIETLEIWAQTMETSCVAIGGITLDNAAPLIRAGADFLAVSAGVWRHPAGPADAVKRFYDLFATALA
ncbi:MAG TPA: thiamine phosphate synthase [Caulobacterales bacterium]|nr:thiamine phosphate synthase [Caulobacterales bacterium]